VPRDTLPRVPLILIVIVLILLFGGGGYYMGPGVGYYGGGGLSLMLALVLIYLILEEADESKRVTESPPRVHRTDERERNPMRNRVALFCLMAEQRDKNNDRDRYAE
jgi:hypothetical protein